MELSPPDGYAAPDVTVFGPLVLTCENLDDGITVTVVNRLLPTAGSGAAPPSPPNAAPTPPPTPSSSSPTASPSPSDSPPPARNAWPSWPDATPGGTLPTTGAGTVLPLGVAGAAALLGAGGVLVVVARRRGARHA